jgi:hypothetical protein
MTQSNPLPRYIAICGNPKVGKSLAQELLIKNYGVRAIDSGLPLREIAMQQYGLTWHQVYTQEGKLEKVNILGREWVVRELLGELGNRFEEMHGDWATPWMTVRRIPATEVGPFCDASCRKNQGAFYKTLPGGGVCIGIRSPNVGPSPYDFDRVREEHVDFWIENDGLARNLPISEARADFEVKLGAGLAAWSQVRKAA